MTKHTVSVIVFAAFALGLPLWGMSVNQHPEANIHGCYGECYETWKQETGGLLAVAAAQAAEKAAASPAELGKQASVSYTHLRAHETVVRISYAVVCL